MPFLTKIKRTMISNCNLKQIIILVKISTRGVAPHNLLRKLIFSLPNHEPSQTPTDPPPSHPQHHQASSATIQNMNASQQEEASMCKERAFQPVQPYITTLNKVIIVPVAGKPAKSKTAKQQNNKTAKQQNSK